MPHLIPGRHELRNVSIAPLATAQAIGVAAIRTIQVSAVVNDTGGSGGPIDVTVLFSPDGHLLVSLPLSKVSGNLYQRTIQTSLSNPNVVTAIEARDGAGNVSTQALTGSLSSAFVVVNLPLIRH